MRPLSNKFYILSAELASLSPRENQERTAELADILGPECKQVNGVYSGFSETSFLVRNSLNSVLELASQFEQECILEHNPDQSVYLVFPSQERKYIGQWTETDTKPNSDHSEIEGRYFLVRNTDENTK